MTRLQADYARYVDGGEAEAWSALYGSRGVLTISDGRRIGGREELTAFAARAPQGVHLQGVPGIEERPDGDIDSVAPFVFFNAETGAIVAGTYLDRMTWEEGRLVFARRHIDIKRPA
ncbi:nuclear transport factor 2 family protein [Thermomonospora echinospora]|uniref:nuclear transport factor 2 family protein n=1 Tax=Thermomonospora echinospora TaxID=1992 RepID=UPI00135A8AF7|nr:nuclear transport factor 2 family protein [Thermomonospora echinospora]